jgi:hypothetical protein
MELLSKFHLQGFSISTYLVDRFKANSHPAIVMVAKNADSSTTTTDLPGLVTLLVCFSPIFIKTLVPLIANTIVKLF